VIKIIKRGDLSHFIEKIQDLINIKILNINILKFNENQLDMICIIVIKSFEFDK